MIWNWNMNWNVGMKCFLVNGTLCNEIPHTDCVLVLTLTMCSSLGCLILVEWYGIWCPILATWSEIEYLILAVWFGMRCILLVVWSSTRRRVMHDGIGGELLLCWNHYAQLQTQKKSVVDAWAEKGYKDVSKHA